MFQKIKMICAQKGIIHTHTPIYIAKKKKKTMEQTKNLIQDNNFFVFYNFCTKFYAIFGIYIISLQRLHLFYYLSMVIGQRNTR